MATNTVSIISLASFLSSIALFLCFQIGLYSYFESIETVFKILNIDLVWLLSRVHASLVFFAVFTLYEAVSYVLLRSLVKNSFYLGTAIRSNFLGAVFSVGVQILIVNHLSHYDSKDTSILETHLQFLNLPYLGFYLCYLSLFHYSEFLIIALVNPAEVKIDSFMLNHSVPYHAALVASWLEYGLELYFLADYKLASALIYVHTAGVVLCMGGEFIRKLAIFTAATNFNHIVQLRRRPEHQLVTSGIYGWFRHPSYVGWFMFSVGTQLVLVNPLCTLGYALASWRFFESRIYTEEEALVAFFGQDYVAYQRRVRIGIPLIRGYQPDPDPGAELRRRDS